MIAKFADWNWESVPVDRYKDEPGTWVSVTRRTLSSSANMGFEVRYFEIGPGGYTSHERHLHEHAVMVVRGQGRVRLAGETHEVSAFDIVHVPSGTPHQFENPYSEPFGIVCTVNADRDRPELLTSTEATTTVV